MAWTADRNTAFVWLDPRQGAFLRAVTDRAEVVIIGAGMHPAARRSAPPELQSRLGVEDIQTDLRAALATTDAKLLLIAADPGSIESPMDDAELLRLATSRGIRILSFEPLPQSVIGLGDGGDASVLIETARIIPPLRDSAGFSSVAEALESFGAPRTVTVAMRGGLVHGSLGARLFDAMMLIHALLGPPETIDAAVITPVASSGVRLTPGENLRTLHGDLTANLRYAGAKAASISLSDRAGRWFRGAALIGEGGCIRLDESGFERFDSEGTTIDCSIAVHQDAAPRSSPDHAAAVFATAIARSLDPHAPRPGPIDLHAVLSMCEAALISARTGQPESPSTVLRMASES